MEERGGRLKNFLDEWNNDSPLIMVHTSGSTGVPKQWAVRKDQMRASACMTCMALDLHRGDSALLCLSTDYIGGKMMVVRSLEWNMQLIERRPSGHPLRDVDQQIDFAAMVPLQVYNSLSKPLERERLAAIGTLIIGGGAIDAELEAEIRKLPGKIFSTYGMTETLSHIALRRLNGPTASQRYVPFESVNLSLSQDQTLVIDAPKVCDTTLITNDIAELAVDGSFVILGRKDTIINTGGIKIQIEQVEEKLRPFIVGRFAITSVPNERLGEEVTLLLEKDAKYDERGLGILSRFECPRRIYRISRIPLTGNGKIDRKSCREQSMCLVKEKNVKSE